MRLAIVGNNLEAEATPGAKGICNGCREEVFAKCGPEMVWHWAHHAGSICSQATTEPETNWHQQWKLLVPPEYREVTVRKQNRLKRADIKAKTQTVVELQHSEISLGEVGDREDFYGRNMFWIFDSDGRHRRIYNSSLGNSMHWNGMKQYEVALDDRIVGIGKTRRPTIVDLGDYICRTVPHPDNRPTRFQCVILPAEQVRHAVSNTCDSENPHVAMFLLDTMTDWIKADKAMQAARRRQQSKGRYMQDFCNRTGERLQRHLQWLTSKTESGSADYYGDGH